MVKQEVHITDVTFRSVTVQDEFGDSVSAVG